jgi:hypothetical protein
VATLENGSLDGRGSGVTMTKDGEALTWKVTGAGRFTQAGSVSWRGSVYYKTASTKLARANGQCCVYEYEVDAQGNWRRQDLYEWK